jgi:hypothetical protein
MASRSTKSGARRQQLLPLHDPAPRSPRHKHAGRPPKGQIAGVSHAQRAALASRFPVHVTIKLRSGLPRLRQKPEYAALRAAFVAAHTARSAATFRLCHYVILNDHLHLVVEAQGRQALSRGLQGLLIRIAKALNKLWSRRGSVFADRYHDRVLRSPLEVRRAIRYVLQNGNRHAAAGRAVRGPQPIDVYSSAPWFDGWLESITVRNLPTSPPPVRAAETWLLHTGWRRHGLLSVHEMPRTG